MPRELVIECQNLTKTVGQGVGQAKILRGINLQIHSGEYLIVIGPSGCGKSTLVNVISGLDEPTEGQVIVRGKDLYKLPEHEIARYHRVSIGRVFQDFNLIKSLTVLENLEIPQILQGFRLSRRQHRAKELLDRFGLGQLARLFPQQMSGGQQQRVAIARAMINNPWILLVDEPTGNLDSEAADEVMKMLEGLHEQGKRTVLLVTHNQDHLKYATRVIKMKDGQLI